jgi:hypothetical protein
MVILGPTDGRKGKPLVMAFISSPEQADPHSSETREKGSSLI